MKKFTKILTTVTMSAGAVWMVGCERSKEDITNIRVCKAAEHEALNAVVQGMEDYLKTRSKRYVVTTETCRGERALASQIIAKFMNRPTDVVVTVGTTPSQVAFPFAKTGKIKLVFSSVTNPDDIAPQLSGTNTTGVSNFIALKPQIEFFKMLQPGLKRLGILYNPGEANAVWIVKALSPLCQEMGIELIPQSLTKMADLPQTAEKLLRMVDAIFVSNDNLVLSGIPSLVALADRAGIPVYVSDTDQVEKGGTAALGPNQYDLGQQTGKIVERIANGEDINKIAVQYPEKVLRATCGSFAPKGTAKDRAASVSQKSGNK